MLVKDKDLSLVSTKSLIVVGTPCSNSVISTVLGIENCSNIPDYLKIGPGQFTIQSKVYNGRVVLLLIGYSSEDVVSASQYLLSHVGQIGTYEGYYYTSPAVSPATYNCTDTDGKKNYYAKGQVVGKCYCTEEQNGVCTSNSCYEDQTTWEDYCAGTSDNSVIEYYCDGQVQNVVSYPCQYGCKDGACIIDNRTFVVPCSSNQDCPIGTLCVDYTCIHDVSKSCMVDAVSCNLEWNTPVCGYVITFVDGVNQLCRIPGVGSGSISADFKFNQKGDCAVVKSCPYGCYNGTCISNTTEADICTKDSDCDSGKCVDGVCTESTNSTNQVSCDSGCVMNDKCYPFGYRKSGQYCLETSQTFTEQLGSDKGCENDFECQSNFCLDSKCMNPTVMQRFFNWLNRMFGRGE